MNVHLDHVRSQAGRKNYWVGEQVGNWTGWLQSGRRPCDGGRGGGVLGGMGGGAGKAGSGSGGGGDGSSAATLQLLGNI